MTYHQCSGCRKGTAIRCHYRGIIKVGDKWFCKLHSPLREQVLRSRKRVSTKKLVELLAQYRGRSTMTNRGRVYTERECLRVFPLIVEEVLDKRMEAS